MSNARANPGARRRAGPRAIAGWVLFDWAAQPTYTLILTFLFAPYFANVFVGDTVRGQALWGYMTAATGLIVALAGPVLGAIADATGRRKPWIALFSAGLIIGLAGLWLAQPGIESRLGPVIGFFMLAIVCVEFATIFTNAMMPGLVSPKRLGRLSGTGWAVGYVGGLVSLVIAAGFIVADPETGRTMLGLKSPLPLDDFAWEGERAIGPFSAAWYLLFVLPLFAFTPDLGSVSRNVTSPVRDGLRQLAETIRHARRYAGIVRFLVARMLYVDGLGAIFAFGGLYASSVFGWTTTELGLFGILLTIAGAAGAFAGGWLDDRLGSRRVIVIALAGLIAAALGIVSVSRGSVFFVVEVAPVRPGASLFAAAGEQIYLAFALVIGALGGPLQAASRTYLARSAPPHMMTEFFGLFAFSGKITAFAAPLLVGLVTAASGSQRAGIAVILLFLGGGLALMLGVEEANRA